MGIMKRRKQKPNVLPVGDAFGLGQQNKLVATIP
jgi:hypothetical protein